MKQVGVNTNPSTGVAGQVGAATPPTPVPPTPPPSGPLLVQQKAATGTNGATGITATFDTPLTAGNAVIAFISFVNATASVSDVSLVGGGAESLNTAGSQADATGVAAVVYFTRNIVGGSTAITLTLDLPARASITAIEVSGLADSSPAASSTNAGTASTAVTTGSVDPIVPNNFIVAMYASVLNSFVSGPTGGLTALTATGGTGAFQREGYIIQAAATAKDVGWTLSPADNWAACAAAFPASAQSSVLVANAGSTVVNRIYLFSGMENSRPTYTPDRTGFPDNNGFVWNGSQWKINGGGDFLYLSADNVVFPWLATTWEIAPGSGADLPVPTVTSQ